MTSHLGAEAIVAAIVVILVAAFVLHLAAGLVTKEPKFKSAILTAVIGGLVASVVAALVPGARVLGLILAIIVWVAVAAAFYRIGWLRAAGLGIVAWLLFLGLTLVVEAIMGTLT